jgi:hypothetical protein
MTAGVKVANVVVTFRVGLHLRCTGPCETGWTAFVDSEGDVRRATKTATRLIRAHRRAEHGARKIDVTPLGSSVPAVEVVPELETVGMRLVDDRHPDLAGLCAVGGCVRTPHGPEVRHTWEKA